MNLFIFYAEVHLILCKDNENRAQSKMNLFIFYAEVHLILCKDNENRAQSKMNLFIFYAEVHQKSLVITTRPLLFKKYQNKCIPNY